MPQPTKKQTTDQDNFTIKPKHILFLTLGLGTLVVALIIFLIASSGCHKIDTSTFNDFGTFYGGIVGTIVAFFGLYFIYRTFEIQEKQFETVKKDADFNIINKLYDNLIQEINSIQIRVKKDPNDEGQVYTGIDALFNFDSSIPNNAVLNHLQSILIAFEHILLLAETKVKYKYDAQKEITLTRIYFLYYEKIIWPVYEKLYSQEKDKLLERGHPGTNELFKKYETLTKETYDFLLEKHYVGKPTESLILNIVERKESKSQ